MTIKTNRRATHPQSFSWLGSIICKMGAVRCARKSMMDTKERNSVSLRKSPRVGPANGPREHTSSLLCDITVKCWGRESGLVQVQCLSHKHMGLSLTPQPPHTDSGLVTCTYHPGIGGQRWEDLQGSLSTPSSQIDGLQVHDCLKN